MAIYNIFLSILITQKKHLILYIHKINSFQITYPFKKSDKIFQSQSTPLIVFWSARMHRGLRSPAGFIFAFTMRHTQTYRRRTKTLPRVQFTCKLVCRKQIRFLITILIFHSICVWSVLFCAKLCWKIVVI